jgi:hypothetical protein
VSASGTYLNPLPKHNSLNINTSTSLALRGRGASARVYPTCETQTHNCTTHTHTYGTKLRKYVAYGTLCHESEKIVLYRTCFLSYASRTCAYVERESERKEGGGEREREREESRLDTER